MAEIESFLGRLGKVNRAVYASGESILEKMSQTIKEMLSDRGFTTICTSQSLLEDAIAGNRVIWGEAPNMATDVFFCTEDKVGVRFARQMLEKTNAMQVICVSLEGPTPFTKKECEGSGIQFLFFSRLVANVTKHTLVPRHVQVPLGEHDVSKLPKILETDPLVQYYNWPIGSIIRIDRVLGCHEPIPYFRVVVPSNN